MDRDPYSDAHSTAGDSVFETSQAEAFVGNSPVVTIYVGPSNKQFQIHQTLLTRYSRVFDKAFNGGDEEDEHDEPNYGDFPAADRNALILHDVDEKLFAFLVRWIYGMTFAVTGSTRSFRFKVPDQTTVTVRDYLGLYVLGRRVKITGLRNAAMDAVYAYYKDGEKCPDMADVEYIFAHEPEESKMRRLLIAHSLFFIFSTNRKHASSHKVVTKDRHGNVVGVRRVINPAGSNPLPPLWESIMAHVNKPDGGAAGAAATGVDNDDPFIDPVGSSAMVLAEGIVAMPVDFASIDRTRRSVFATPAPTSPTPTRGPPLHRVGQSLMGNSNGGGGRVGSGRVCNNRIANSRIGDSHIGEGYMDDDEDDDDEGGYPDDISHMAPFLSAMPTTPPFMPPPPRGSKMARDAARQGRASASRPASRSSRNAAHSDEPTVDTKTESHVDSGLDYGIPRNSNSNNGQDNSRARSAASASYMYPPANHHAAGYQPGRNNGNGKRPVDSMSSAATPGRTPRRGRYSREATSGLAAGATAAAADKPIATTATTSTTAGGVGSGLHYQRPRIEGRHLGGEIAFYMLRMLASWNWVMGQGCPHMSVKPYLDFHEVDVELMPAGIKQEHARRSGVPEEVSRAADSRVPVIEIEDDEEGPCLRRRRRNVIHLD